jgi:hypothetical protein
MDQEQLQAHIAAYYSRLPADIQEKLARMDWLMKLKEISAKYGLGSKQIETLGMETTLVLLGAVHVDEYQKTLAAELALPQGIQERLIADINTSILNDIRPGLIEAFNIPPLMPAPQAADATESKLDVVPADVQDAMNQENYTVALGMLAQKYDLNQPQVEMLQRVIIDAMRGSIDDDKVSETLEGDLAMSEEEVEALMRDVNDRLFTVIKENMGVADANPSNEIVLKNAGITLAPENTQVRTPAEIHTEEPIENRDEIMAKIEHPDNVVPVPPPTIIKSAPAPAPVPDPVLPPAPEPQPVMPSAPEPAQQAVPAPAPVPVSAPAPQAPVAPEKPAKVADPYRMPIE